MKCLKGAWGERSASLEFGDSSNLLEELAAAETTIIEHPEFTEPLNIRPSSEETSR